MLSRSALTRVARPILRSSSITKCISTTTIRNSDHAAPTLYGEGAKAGTVPTDENQATGLERLQMLGQMEGIDIFLRKPDFSKKGTMASPIMVPSLAETRIIGCTGYPPEDHRTLWYQLKNDGKKARCKECGCG
ncbi:hypothetical protein Clacol_002367 [Clathrus columnatus]|uniref:Uncharacterized protein n=1 Tax=Clathrus columnatus TaxID=1419009 RepID=A0AAV5A0M7_9AGAM|nr:hypothetical protein Clacol_002367 [Clathrus columnatus]